MKHLVDLGENAPAGARERLGTTTITDTVNAAPNLAASHPSPEGIDAALDALAGTPQPDRDSLWR